MLALGVAPWLGVVALAGLRARGQRTAGAFALLGALSLLGLLLAYAAGLQSQVPGRIPWRNIGTVLWTSMKFLSTGLGPAGAEWHPLSTTLTGLLFFGACILLTRSIIVERGRRIPDSGRLFLLIALLALAAGVTWGRHSRSGDLVFSMRYVTLAAPLWCLAHLMGSSRRPNRMGRIVSRTIAILLVLALPQNMLAGMTRSADVSRRLHAFEVDVWSGMSTPELARRHAGLVYPDETRLRDGIKRLRAAGFGPFRPPLADREAELRLEYWHFLHDHRSSPWLPVLLEDGENRTHLALLSPAPGRLEFRVPAGRWQVSGSHGLRRDSWMVGRTDGVVFSIHTRSEQEGEREVYRRLLRPFDDLGDRGPVPFDTFIETDSSVDVWFITDPGPARDRSFDWSYWSDLAIVPAGTR